LSFGGQKNKTKRQKTILKLLKKEEKTKNSNWVAPKGNARNKNTAGGGEGQVQSSCFPLRLTRRTQPRKSCKQSSRKKGKQKNRTRPQHTTPALKGFRSEIKSQQKEDDDRRTHLLGYGFGETGPG